MTPADLVGSVGVAMLLAAFALNATGRVQSSSRAYQAVNLVGASLSATASWMIDYLPFVVLEASWALVALYALLRPAPRLTDPAA